MINYTDEEILGYTDNLKSLAETLKKCVDSLQKDIFERAKIRREEAQMYSEIMSAVQHANSLCGNVSNMMFHAGWLRDFFENKIETDKILYP